MSTLDRMARLLKWADVLTENFKPGTLDNYGYTYEQCAEWNPRLIYCVNSGFGDRGPMGRSGSFDSVAQFLQLSADNRQDGGARGFNVFNAAPRPIRDDCT